MDFAGVLRNLWPGAVKGPQKVVSGSLVGEHPPEGSPEQKKPPHKNAAVFTDAADGRQSVEAVSAGAGPAPDRKLDVVAGNQPVPPHDRPTLDLKG